MINSFTLIINYSDSQGERVHKRFMNISRVAVKTFVDYYIMKQYDSLYWDVEEYNGRS